MSESRAERTVRGKSRMTSMDKSTVRLSVSATKSSDEVNTGPETTLGRITRRLEQACFQPFNSRNFLKTRDPVLVRFVPPSASFETCSAEMLARTSWGMPEYYGIGRALTFPFWDGFLFWERLQAKNRGHGLWTIQRCLAFGLKEAEKTSVTIEDSSQSLSGHSRP
jgi:hypothetical protein